MLKYYKKEDYLYRYAGEIFVYGDFYQTTEEGRNFIFSLLVYFFEVTKFDSAKTKKVIEQISKPLKSTSMSTLQLLKEEGLLEGNLEGLLEGILSGKLEGKLGKLAGKEEVALRLIAKFPEWTDLLISDVTGLPEKKIKELRDRPSKPRKIKKTSSVN